MQKRLKNVDGIIEVHDARISFHDSMWCYCMWYELSHQGILFSVTVQVEYLLIQQNCLFFCFSLTFLRSYDDMISISNVFFSIKYQRI